MAQGADINALPIPVIDIDSACTALQAALMSAVSRRLDLVSAMLDLGADHASYDESSPDFEWLLAQGADRTIKDNNWQARLSSRREVAYRRAAGVDVNAMGHVASIGYIEV